LPLDHRGDQVGFAVEIVVQLGLTSQGLAGAASADTPAP
jgi:hypothetical protein